MKKLIIVSMLSVFLLFAFTLTPKNSESATMPEYLFSNYGRLIISVADLGMLVANEWEIIVYTEWPDPVNFGIGMRFYHPGRAEFGFTVIADDAWITHGHYGIWGGSGSTGYCINPYGGTWTETLTTAPPASAESSSEALDQR